MSILILAQWEIQQYAQQVEGMFQQKMPFTHGAFLVNERVAP